MLLDAQIVGVRLHRYQREYAELIGNAGPRFGSADARHRDFGVGDGLTRGSTMFPVIVPVMVI